MADVGYRHLELFVYLSDVTPGVGSHPDGARRLTRDIPVERTYLSLDEYAPLYGSEVPLRAARFGAWRTGPTCTTAGRR